MTEKPKKLYYHGIDVLKFFMALCVIATHTKPLENCSIFAAKSLFDALIVTAVPFFFISFGFLMSANKPDLDSRIFDNVKRVGKLYLIWTVLYLPLTVYGFFQYKSLKSAIFFFVRNIFFVGQNFNSWPLWYLLCAFYSLLLLFFLKSKLKFGITPITVFSAIMFFAGHTLTYLCRNISDLSGVTLKLITIFEKLFTEGRIFTGLFYIMIGIILAQNFDKAKKFSHEKKPILLVAFIVGFLGRAFIPLPFGSFIMPIYVTSLFVLALDFCNSQKNTTCLGLRRMSTVIYFLHMIVYSLFTLAVMHENEIYGLTPFAVTTAVTAAISFIIVEQELSKKHKLYNKITKTIFS